MNTQKFIREAVVNKEEILKLFNIGGIKAKYKIEFKEDWDTVFSNLNYQFVASTDLHLEYQSAYHSSSDAKITDVSVVIYRNLNPIAVFPLCIEERQNQIKLSSFGKPINEPLYAKYISNNEKKSLTKKVINSLKLIARSLELDFLILEQASVPHSDNNGCSEWHIQLLSEGALLEIKHDMFLDLSPDLKDIRSRYRSSYKSLINRGLELWNISVMESRNASRENWDDFKELHRDAAGRVTRSELTWEIQCKMISNDCAFLVMLREKNASKLVGAAFFEYTKNEAYYSVGAYDRSYFDFPLGHVAQHTAIQKFKIKSIGWYRIGERFYPKVSVNCSSKEVSISNFKQGFSDHLICRFIYKLEIHDF